jgi:hypothetical protein
VRIFSGGSPPPKDIAFLFFRFFLYFSAFSLLPKTGAFKRPGGQPGRFLYFHHNPSMGPGSEIPPEQAGGPPGFVVPTAQDRSRFSGRGGPRAPVGPHLHYFLYVYHKYLLPPFKNCSQICTVGTIIPFAIDDIFPKLYNFLA